MFTSIADRNSKPVEFTLFGRVVRVPPGISVAAAMLANGEAAGRVSASGSPRGPYCLMGACFECSVIIDGRARVRACMTEVRDGLNVERSQHVDD
ncbi:MULTISPECIES: (2Fe-2S)-binding protein [unclassified Aminobacter]|uniref:(2Fe-2S)-binding protein n=1 Tax=unclassified Aminobacter TaxID=2644704 RepID=UPI00046787C8|nr:MULTISPECIES: (2Fe-2S)-binding protein [unclassified Aminobacter]TWH28162.1 2Fe-2S iron-sulfur cluster protein [Aminobacter sp. J15]